jgi:hypothetical protein
MSDTFPAASYADIPHYFELKTHPILECGFKENI